MHTANTVGGGISHDHQAKEHLGRGDSERVSLLSHLTLCSVGGNAAEVGCMCTKQATQQQQKTK